MSDYHFISYSSIDGREFAFQLQERLEAATPPFHTWIDKYKMMPVQNWHSQVENAISGCASLLYVMTVDSVSDASVCSLEVASAREYKKPIIPIRLDHKIGIPFILRNRLFVDFTVGFENGFVQLCERLNSLNSPQGRLDLMAQRLAYAEHELRRARDDSQKLIIQEEIDLLKKQITNQKNVIANTELSSQRAEERIKHAIEQERLPKKYNASPVRSKFIKMPPGIPNYFQNRFDETAMVGEFLKNDVQRVITVAGRGGIGKTTMICRVLRSLAADQLPDDGGSLKVDHMIYLDGLRGITTFDIYNNLCKLLPADISEELLSLYKSQESIEAKMYALLAELSQENTILALENFEHLIDTETLTIIDNDLGTLLRAVLEYPYYHALKVIITSRIIPSDLALYYPERQGLCTLDEGLQSPFAEECLRKMDVQGKAGLRDAPASLLNKARERTRGFPLALVSLYRLLLVKRASLAEVIDDTKTLLPENVLEALIGEAFKRLDSATQMVMQALAVYNRPVTSTAIAYLLRPYLFGVDSDPILERLVEMHFVLKRGERYELHPVDRSYAFSLLERGEVSDRYETAAPPFSQIALLNRGADFFSEVRRSSDEWKSKDDITPQLAEFDLRIEGEDYDAAADLQLSIDQHLLHWSADKVIADNHRRLLGRISQPALIIASLTNLGMALLNLGQHQEAITYQVQALAIARDSGADENIGFVLGHLGDCYMQLGHTYDAISHYEKVVALARATGDKESEASWLGNLGICYSQLGLIDRALTYFRQALDLAREMQNRYMVAVCLNNMGYCYAILGEPAKSIEACEKALALHREVGNLSGEGEALHNLAEVFIDEERYSTAIEYATRGAQIAKEVNSPKLGSENNIALACAYLYRGQLSDAKISADSAQKFYEPQNNHYVQFLTGVIALKQKNLTAALQAFETALDQACHLLVYNPKNFKAMDIKGLALCGLALCRKDDSITEASESYKAARQINHYAGTLKRVRRLFDTLAVEDAAGALSEVSNQLAT